jgi:hypothetical protein
MVESGRGVTLTPYPILVPRSETEYIYIPAGPYLGTLRPWAQETFAPPLFVRIQLCVNENNTTNCGTNIVFSIDFP